MYRTRALGALLRSAAAGFPAIVLTGPRQSGKTTLLKKTFGRTHGYVAMDAPDQRRRAAADPRGFLELNPAPVVLDEIHAVPELLGYLKERIDEDRRPGRWVLSSSQHFALMRGVTESLAGRAAVLTLLPFSWAERYGAAPTSLTTLAKRMLRGLYPQPSTRRAVRPWLWYSSYLQTYLERDVRGVVAVADLSTFETFLRLLATRTGQLLNLSDLARDAGISHATARRWSSVLETTGTIFLLRPYYRNLGKRLVKAPKLYLIDTGLAAYLFGIDNPRQLLASPYFGALFETLAISEWIKAFRNAGREPRLWFWRSSDGTEVDLVVDHAGRAFGFEVKATATPNPGHASSLRKWRALAGSAAAAVLCPTPAPAPLAESIRAEPWVAAVQTWAAAHLRP